LIHPRGRSSQSHGQEPKSLQARTFNLAKRWCPYGRWRFWFQGGLAAAAGERVGVAADGRCYEYLEKAANLMLVLCAGDGAQQPGPERDGRCVGSQRASPGSGAPRRRGVSERRRKLVWIGCPLTNQPETEAKPT
jgi:hypothetical protein